MLQFKSYLSVDFEKVLRTHTISKKKKQEKEKNILRLKVCLVIIDTYLELFIKNFLIP